MRAYIAFLKKEFVELVRTYKLFILLAVFLIIGMMNPLTAKLTPMILENFADEGMTFTVSEPTAMDSWMQFFKNTTTGIIAYVILLSGIMSQEYSKSTLVNIITKGLPRRTVILAKFTSSILIWTVAYLLNFFTTLGYTEYFWGNQTPPNLAFSVVCLWAFGVLITSAIIFGASAFSSNYGSMLFTGGFSLVLTLINIAPKAIKYNPMSLSSRNLELLKETAEISDFTIPLIISLVLCIIFIFLAIENFNNKKL